MVSVVKEGAVWPAN